MSAPHCAAILLKKDLQLRAVEWPRRARSPSRRAISNVASPVMLLCSGAAVQTAQKYERSVLYAASLRCGVRLSARERSACCRRSR